MSLVDGADHPLTHLLFSFLFRPSTSQARAWTREQPWNVSIRIPVLNCRFFRPQLSSLSNGFFFQLRLDAPVFRCEPAIWGSALKMMGPVGRCLDDEGKDRAAFRPPPPSRGGDSGEEGSVPAAKQNKSKAQTSSLPSQDKRRSTRMPAATAAANVPLGESPAPNLLALPGVRRCARLLRRAVSIGR